MACSDSPSWKLVAKAALLVFCSVLAFLSYSHHNRALRKQDMNVSLDMDYTTHIKDCVPHYALLLQEKNRAMEAHREPDSTFSLMAAYKYEDYSVVTTQAMGVFGRKVFCRYFYVISSPSNTEIGPAVESFVFPEYAVYCCTRDKARFMSVTENANDSVVEYVRIVDRRFRRPKYSLSLCLSPMYGSERKWLLLAELVEHNKLQGVEYFYLYVKDMDDYTNELITNYVRSGLAEVVLFHRDKDRLGKLWQLVFLQHFSFTRNDSQDWCELFRNNSGFRDCLQRSRRHSKYVIIQDLNERILPTDNMTVRELVRGTMESDSTIAMVSFPSLEFMMTLDPPLEYRGNRTLDIYLPTLAFHKNKITETTPKYAIDPTKVLIMWDQSVSVFLPGYREHHFTPEEVIMRHYSGIATEEIPDLALLNDTAYPAELMSILYSKVEKTLNQVYRIDKN
ncbi:hypothetical protein Y032_0106g3770 [Ancylostoma ceylanicum]|uniref:Glycosyltransferase family 92 protein n=1 Tax=Ancylostoma ceylanicum TaxID=53326 RepID=A0A016TG13_9BILA|nr:hypothetical protein Y032_0106g3770 [Ancylostoma ceylanicum]